MIRSDASFLITIDTEGDNLWGRSHSITTENSRYLPRFQELCERYQFKPTYLTNWEMLHCPVFREFAHDVIRRGTGEIGMHLHAWNSPPLEPLTADDYVHHPYLIEYPERQLREKVHVMTCALEEQFQIKMCSHRAGRWGFNEIYARALIDEGYCVDCSVSPHVSWKAYKGNPSGRGGPDFTDFPETAYFMDLEDIRRPGSSDLLEVPLTVTPPHYPAPHRAARSVLHRAGSLGRRAANRFFPRYSRLVPNGRNRWFMKQVIAAARQDGRDFVEFMLHSSEFMPAGSPNFPTVRSIDALFDDMEAVFDAARGSFTGRTLSEYHAVFSARTSPSKEIASPSTTHWQTEVLA